MNEKEQEEIDKWYGFCQGCGGQEPVEVLEQMNGYCSSQCEKEDNDG